MVVNEKFSEWAKTLVGCDGGNIEAPIYISGIEWGGNGTDSLYPFTFEYEKGGRQFPARTQKTVDDDPKITTYNFDQKVAKLLIAMYPDKYKGFDFSQYIRQKYCFEHGDIFKFNLFPISFRSHHDILWSKDHYKLTGFPTKYQYQAWCVENRFPVYRELIEKYEPKWIVCFGAGYRNDFIMAFGEPQMIFQEGKRHKVGELRNGKPKEIEILQIGEKTSLVVSPFLSGAYGLRSDEEIKTLAKILST